MRCRLNPAVLLALSATLAAQQPLEPTYTLDQTVRAVVLDVVVTDHSGHPIPNLTAKDFTVIEDGIPQRIDLFERPVVHMLPTASAGKQGESLLRSAGAAPLTMLLIDEVSTEPEDLAYSRRQAADYLQKQPAQLASPTTLLVLTGSQLKVLCNYTTGRDQLIAAVKSDHEPPSWYVLRDRVPGFKATGQDTSAERLAIYLGTLNQLAYASEAQHQRKNLIWIGPGLPGLNNAATIASPAQDAIQHALRRTATTLLAARMTLYTVDPEGIATAPTQIASTHVDGNGGTELFVNGGDPAEAELSFERLATDTGGRIYRLRNDIAAEIGEGVRDGADYYTLSYYPTNKVYDGSFRHIRVALSDANLLARTRDGYDAARTPDSATSQPQTALALALTSSLRYQSIAISARLSPDTLHILVDTADLHWDADASGQKRVANVTIVTANVGKDGKILNYKQAQMHATKAAVTPAATPPARDAEPQAGDPAAAASQAQPEPHSHAEFDVPAAVTPAALSFRVLVRDEATGHLGSADLQLK